MDLSDLGHEKALFILRFAHRSSFEAGQPDLIVTSAHGHGGVKRLLLGSVTDRVIRSCEFPVLVVPCS